MAPAAAVVKTRGSCVELLGKGRVMTVCLVRVVDNVGQLVVVQLEPLTSLDHSTKLSGSFVALEPCLLKLPACPSKSSGKSARADPKTQRVS